MAALSGRVAVVTGASRGIGRAVAAALAAQGARVAGCARRPATPGSGPGPELLWPCDVGRAEDVAGFVAAVVGRLGRPDLLVNNAGIVVRAPLSDLAEADFDAVLNANLKGTYLVTRAFLPFMRERPGARIVNMSSISGRQGTAGLTAYCAAKHGVVGLTRALAEELRPLGIPVNAVCPGSVDTDMLRQGMPGAKADMTPEDVARVVLFLAIHAPVALTGACLDVFG